MPDVSTPMLADPIPETSAWRGPSLARDQYEDHPEAERRRHLVRLWLRAGDRRHFRG